MDDVLTALGNVFNAAKGGQYLLAGAMLVIVAVGLMNKYLSGPLGFLEQGKWKWTTAIVTGVLLAVAHGLIASGGKLGSFGGVLVTALNGALAGLVGAGLVKGWNEHSATDPAASVPPTAPTDTNSVK